MNKLRIQRINIKNCKRYLKNYLRFSKNLILEAILLTFLLSHNQPLLNSLVFLDFNQEMRILISSLDNVILSIIVILILNKLYLSINVFF